MDVAVKSLKPLVISGREVLPLVEGGKGIAVSNGESSAAWAAAGAVGTFSGVNADFYDENGKFVPVVYHGKTRRERHGELLAYAIRGGIAQARIAHDTAGGQGRIHMNVIWEMGGAEHILHGVMEGAKGLVHGVTCGAGMPYKVAEIAASYGVYYYPIVSSARAFSALWKRAHHKYPEWLGGVVYEDPWLAGGQTACPIRKIRKCRSRLCPGCANSGPDACVRCAGSADFGGRRRLVSARMGGFPR